jgi:hypothetical protein
MSVCISVPSFTTPNDFSDIMASEMVTIKVGANAVQYRVHEAVLTHYSAYFRSALRSGMEESSTRTFTLLDVGQPIFDAFVDWLYSQRLPSGDAMDLRYPRSKDFKRDMYLISLYAFADRFLVSDLKPAVMERIVDCYNKFALPNRSAVAMAFEHLPIGSPVQQLLVDVFRRGGKAAINYEDPMPLEQLPSAFLCQVLMKYAANVQCDKFPFDAANYQGHDQNDSGGMGTGGTAQ